MITVTLVVYFIPFFLFIGFFFPDDHSSEKLYSQSRFSALWKAVQTAIWPQNNDIWDPTSLSHCFLSDNSKNILGSSQSIVKWSGGLLLLSIFLMGGLVPGNFFFQEINPKLELLTEYKETAWHKPMGWGKKTERKCVLSTLCSSSALPHWIQPHTRKLSLPQNIIPIVRQFKVLTKSPLFKDARLNL